MAALEQSLARAINEKGEQWPTDAESSSIAVSAADGSHSASTTASTSPSSPAPSADGQAAPTLFPTVDKAGVAIVTQWDARSLLLPNDSVDLIVTSPPYFALRSYQDGGEALDGQIGAEPSPKEFVAALVDCTREWLRVLKPTGNLFVNLGDKYAGSGGHNNGGISKPRSLYGKHAEDIDKVTQAIATRRNAPDRYNQSSDGIRPKSLMGLPWRYALECVDTLGLILRAEIIWDKPNGLPESVKDRVARKHEQWFHFALEGDHYGNVDPIREPKAAHSIYCAGWEASKPGGYSRRRRTAERADGGSPKASASEYKVPGSVWRVTSEPFKAPAELGVDHYAAFPSEFPRRIISAWCPPGGIVLDPFGGTGTVALAAQELGRVGISNDLSGDYCRLAQWRTTDPKQRQRMRRRIEENKRGK